MKFDTETILEQRVREVIDENGHTNKTEGVGWFFLRHIITSCGIKLELALDFAEYYKVSLDWLLGRTDEKYINGGKQE